MEQANKCAYESCSPAHLPAPQRALRRGDRPSATSCSRAVMNTESIARAMRHAGFIHVPLESACAIGRRSAKRACERRLPTSILDMRTRPTNGSHHSYPIAMWICPGTGSMILESLMGYPAVTTSGA